MKNKKLEVLIYFFLAVLFAGLAYFMFEEFEPAGNVSEFSILNALSWIGQRTGKIPIVIIISLLSLFYFYKSIRLLRSK